MNIILVLVKKSIVVKQLFNHLVAESQKTLDIGQCKNRCSRDSSDQEKMRGQRGRLPVQPLRYVMSTKVIFRRAEVSVLAVWYPRRPHAGLMFERKAKITCNVGQSGLNVCR